MASNHPDMVIAHKVSERLSIDLEVVNLEDKLGDDHSKVFDQSLSLHDPAFNSIVNHAFGYFGRKEVSIIDGSIIGVVKNFFGYLWFISGKDLARIAGYPKSQYAKEVFSGWLAEIIKLKKRFGHSILDMFFWEDRAGNWAAKGKSKFLIVCNHISVFNSRKLFDTMLRTKRKNRDAQNHKIFQHILSNSELPLHDIPINPTPRKKIIRLFKIVGLYPLYRNIAIKTGLLNFK